MTRGRGSDTRRFLVATRHGNIAAGKCAAAANEETRWASFVSVREGKDAVRQHVVEVVLQKRPDSRKRGFDQRYEMPYW